MKRTVTAAWQKTRSLGRDESGAALVITLALFLFLFIMVSAVYAVGETIQQKIELQNACDAAAYSAAVVQADGLSRMATINKAMSWTYVQMSKRQMDYITYRFLRLTEQRFIQDYNNAKDYHACCSFYKSIIQIPIPTGSWVSCKHKHHKEGTGWWCGTGPGTKQHRKLRINGREIEIDDLTNVLNAFGSQWDDDGCTYNQVSPPKPDTIPDNEADISNVETALLAYYNKSKKDLLLTQYNQNQQTPVNQDDAGFQEWLASKNYQDVSDPTDSDYVAWLKENGYSETTETEGGVQVTYTWQENLADDLYQKFLSYTGSSDPALPGNNASQDEWNQYHVDSANMQIKFNAWIASLNEEQCVYLAQGKGDPGVAASIPKTIPSGLNLHTYTPTPPTQTNPTPTVLSEYEKWGFKLGQKIDYDKRSIDMMYAALTMINANMTESMRDTARLVLERNIKASHPDLLDDFIYTISVPNVPDPYEVLASSPDEPQLSFYFSALPNTEAGERVFLEMGADGAKYSRLAEYFGTKDQNDEQEICSAGLDQWFIRGCAKYTEGVNQDENGVYFTPQDTYRFAQDDKVIGGEGTPGIMRVYKSAGINETGAGFIYNQVDRGNHYFSLPNPQISFGASTGGDTILGKCFELFKEALLDPLLKDLNQTIQSTGQQLIDCAPSCENMKDSNYAMCKNVQDTIALYSEYDWASAKWWCFWKRKRFSFRKKWIAHFPFPKWFCGSEPTHLIDGGILGVNLGPLSSMMDVLPPIFPPDDLGTTHGYLKDSWDVVGFLGQADPIIRGKSSISREEYRSCVIMPDDPTFFLKGHARIYGDDKDIWDSRYAGVQAKPWVLNEKFFNGQGTIIVGLARKHTNPFYWLNRNLSEKNIKRGIFSFFNTPSYLNVPANYVTAMSAARAAVRRRRANDPSYHYCVSYDNRADAEMLVSNEKGRKWMPLGNNPDDDHIHIGCVCGNTARLSKQWNLSETDWDATLLPLRFARRASNGSRWDDDDNVATLDNPFINSVWQSLGNSTSTRTGIPKSIRSTEDHNEIDSKELLKLKIY